MVEGERRSGRFVSRALPWLLMLPSFLWIALDEHVWPWDQAWYGETAVDLWWTIRHDPSHWVHAMTEAFGTKAPGLAWLGQWFVPLGNAAGSVEFGLLFFTVVTNVLTLSLFIRIGTFLWQGDRRGGWLMAVLGAASPLLMGMGHQFMVEALQLLAVSYFFWLVVAGGGRTRAWLLGQGLIAGSLAMIAKVTSPLYCGLVGLLLLGRIFFAARNFSPAGTRERIKEMVGLSVGLVGTAAMLKWYFHNLETIRAFVKLATYSDVALYYGRLPEFWPKWKFWLGATQAAFVLPVVSVSLGILATAALIAQRIRAELARPDRWHFGLMAAGAATVGLTLFFFTRQVNEDVRYLLPMCPALLVPVVGLLGRGLRRVVFPAVLVATVLQWAVVAGAALGWRPMPAGVTPWLIALESDKTKKRDVRAVIRATTSAETAFRYNVNSYECPWLNANSLAFYAAMQRLKTGIRCYYTPLGYAATDVEAVWARVHNIPAESFIGLEASLQPQPPDFLNQTALPTLQRMETDPQYRKLIFPNPSGIVIFQRRPPSG